MVYNNNVTGTATIQPIKSIHYIHTITEQFWLDKNN
jgi:hypothetical protein